MNLILRKPEEIFKRGVSVSMTKLWLTCRRKFYNQYVRGLAKAPGVEADFGKVFHKFLSNYYLKNDTVEKAIEDFKVIWPIEMDTEKRSQDLGVRLIREYYKRYPRETEPFKLLWHSEETMDGMTVELPKGTRLFIILDSYVEQHGGVYVLEHKTASQLGATYFEQYDNDYQIVCELYALGKHLGKQVEGCIINGIGCKKVVNADSFLRSTITKTQVQVDYMIKNFEQIAIEMINYVTANYEDVEAFPMTAMSGACKSFNTKCPYFDICQFGDNLNLANNLIRRIDENTSK